MTKKARGNLAIFIVLAAVGWYCWDAGSEAMSLPIVVKSIATGKAVRVEYKDGTAVKVTRMTVLPKKYSVVWENPEGLQARAEGGPPR